MTGPDIAKAATHVAVLMLQTGMSAAALERMELGYD